MGQNVLQCFQTTRDYVLTMNFIRIQRELNDTCEKKSSEIEPEMPPYLKNIKRYLKPHHKHQTLTCSFTLNICGVAERRCRPSFVMKAFLFRFCACTARNLIHFDAVDFILEMGRSQK